jgi:hypothetical protein
MKCLFKEKTAMLSEPGYRWTDRDWWAWVKSIDWFVWVLGAMAFVMWAVISVGCTKSTGPNMKCIDGTVHRNEGNYWLSLSIECKPKEEAREDQSLE